MRKDNITRLDVAKELRAVGLPLNTTVEDCEFSPQAEKKLIAALKATKVFGDAVVTWIENLDDERRYTTVCRRWEKLYDALTRAHARPKARETVNSEAIVLAKFVEPYVVVCSQWGKLLTALANGKKRRVVIGKAPWPLGPWPEYNRVALL